MANQLLRKGAEATGSLDFVYTAHDGGNPRTYYAGFDANGNGMLEVSGEGHATSTGLFGVDGKWRKYDGMQ